MTTEAEPRRRFRIHDAIVLIAVSAVAVPSANALLPEIVPLVQKLRAMHFFDHVYPQHLFHASMRSGRMESIGLQFRRIVEPVKRRVEPGGRYIDRKTGQPVSYEKALENWMLTHSPPGAEGFAAAQDGYYLVFPFLFVWSFGLMILRLLRPRPAPSALFRQPGWWACFGSMLGVMLAYTVEIVIECPAPSIIAPATVMFAWLALALSRKWNSEPSWIDRAGRLMGIFWLMTIPVYLTGFVLSQFN
jgi:hypothetical protein